MNKMLIKLCLLVVAGSFVLSSVAQADEIFIHKLAREQKASLEKEYQAASVMDDMYVAVGLHMPIIPSDLSFALGYEIADGLAEVELYISARLSRFFTDEHDLHLPVGARIRIPLNGARTIFIEYQREFFVAGESDYGRLETPNLVSVVKRFEGHDVYFGCGVGNSVHHAWSNEDHAPEDGIYFECKFGKKF